MSDELKTIKFQMMLSESEAKQIDDWGFAHRIRSRAEAIRRLCQVGMLVDDASENIVDKSNETFEFMSEWAEKYTDYLKSLPDNSIPRWAAMEIGAMTVDNFSPLSQHIFELHHQLYALLVSVDRVSYNPDLQEGLEEAKKAQKEAKMLIQEMVESSADRKISKE